MAALSVKKHPEKEALNNSGTSELARMRSIDQIKKHPTFENLFQIKPNILKQIKVDMKAHGFNKSKPLDNWKEADVLIDGYTRLRAAKEIGLREVPVYDHSFSSETEALEYALGIQIARRNLNDAELVLAIAKLDSLKPRGRKKDEESAKEEKGRSSEKLAEKLGINVRKVEKVRAISKEADEETKEAVKEGKLSINAAYKRTKEKNKPVPEPEQDIITKPVMPDLDPLPEEDIIAEPAIPDIDPLPEATRAEVSEYDTKDEIEKLFQGADKDQFDNISKNALFLRAAVMVLHEKNERNAIEILTNHFLREDERTLFRKLFPKIFGGENN